MRVISYSPPLLARISLAVGPIGVSAVVIVTSIPAYASSRASAGVFVPAAAFGLISMTMAYRIMRLAFRADASGLVIRNFLVTRRVPLDQIIGFDIGGSVPILPNALRVITRSGTFRVDVYGHIKILLLFLDDDLFDIADQLDDWLEDARAAQRAGSR